MIDPANIQGLVQSALDKTAGTGPVAPEPSDVDTFQAAMDGQGSGGAAPAGSVDPAMGAPRPLDGVEPVAEPVPTGETVTTDPAADQRTPGEAILGMLEQMRTSSGEEAEKLQQAVEGLGSDGQVSMKELLNVQYQMTTYMLQQDLASKTVSKSTQNVETLLKNQ